MSKSNITYEIRPQDGGYAVLVRYRDDDSLSIYGPYTLRQSAELAIEEHKKMLRTFRQNRKS